MRLSRDVEAAYLQTIRRTPAACIYVVPDARDPHPPALGVGPYVRPDGSLMIYRGNTQERLHRRYYRLLRDPKLGRHQLERICPTWGCFNPWHYERRAELLRGPNHCPHGHDYTPGNLTPEGTCLTCATARRSGRVSHRPTVAAVNSAKTSCPHGHPYDEANTAVFTDRRGRSHRKCKTCARAAAAAHRKGTPEMTESTAA